MKKTIYARPEKVSEVLRRENAKQNKNNEFYNIFAWKEEKTKIGLIKITIG